MVSMMKKLLLLAAAAVLASGAYTAQAAPVTYMSGLGGNVGYSYNGAADGIHNIYMEFSPLNRLVLGAEYRDWINRDNETDVYAKYRLGHFYVGLGNRNYNDRDAKTFGLVEGMTNVFDRVDAYAGLKVSSAETEARVGLLYDLMPSVDIDLNYTYYDRDDTSNEDGVGIGVNYRF